MSDILIREALPSDLETVMDLTGLWEAENITYGLRRDTPEDLEGCIVWVAEENGRIVGFAAGRGDISKRRTSILDENEVYFELEELYVLPGARKDGLGDRLFKQAESYAREKGFKHLMLSTATKDTMAMLRFYVEKEQMQVWSMRLFKEL